MENQRLLCITGMHVLSTKLIPEHCPNQASLRNMVSATKYRGMTSTKRLYEKVFGNRCRQCDTSEIVMLEVAERVEVETDQDHDDFGI